MFSWLFPNTCAFCQHPVEKTVVCCEYCQRLLPKVPFPSEMNAAFYYEPPIERTILQLKFHGQLGHANTLAQLFIEHLKSHPRQAFPTRLIPIPLHPKRLCSRGFNQASEIARIVAKYFSMNLDLTSCVRVKNTKPQSELPSNKRAKNVKNAFALRHPISDQHVAVFDDVITTGNTINELTRLLNDVGIDTVERWGIAKTKW